MLGREVTAATDLVGRQATGDTEIRYRLPEPAAQVVITVLDGQGRAVRSVAGSTAAGDNVVRWDGLTAAGARAPAGSYRVRVEASRADGTAVAAEQYLTGIVDGIEPNGGSTRLIVAGASVPLTTVQTVH